MNRYNLTEHQKQLLLSNSIERVIDTSMNIAAGSITADNNVEPNINLDDWEALKPIVVRLWETARNELHREAK